MHSWGQTHVKNKTTAFRWLKLHNVTYVGAQSNECVYIKGNPIIEHLSVRDSEDDEHYFNQGNYLFNTIKDSIIVTHGCTSQTKKEAIVWHEIGHYIDLRQTGLKMASGKSEARASQKAIKLMKKNDRWKEYKRQWFLDWFDSYERPYYRYLIEQA